MQNLVAAIYRFWSTVAALLQGVFLGRVRHKGVLVESTAQSSDPVGNPKERQSTSSHQSRSADVTDLDGHPVTHDLRPMTVGHMGNAAVDDTHPFEQSLPVEPLYVEATTVPNSAVPVPPPKDDLGEIDETVGLPQIEPRHQAKASAPPVDTAASVEPVELKQNNVAEPASGAVATPPASSALRRPLKQPSGRRLHHDRGATAAAKHVLHVSLPADYLNWNQALIEQCFSPDAGKSDVYLSVTPGVLASTLSRFRAGATAERARELFVNSVAAAYKVGVLSETGGMTVFLGRDAVGRPLSVAFLAASVLAAYDMRSDEAVTARAYYARLAGLLACGRVGTYPRGFRTRDFEALWQALSAWLSDHRGLRLALPAPDVVRRYVALPLAHVPLRQVDIERLPEFFLWSEYAPDVRISEALLRADLLRWSRTGLGFTVAGTSALHDERQNAVLAQVAQELRSWDGVIVDRTGRQIATVELLLDVVRRQPHLFLLARKPRSFPMSFDDGTRTLESGAEGWYHPIKIDEESGAQLKDGFVWEAIVDGNLFELRRTGSSVFVLTPAEFTGFLTGHRLRLGVIAAVLAHEDVVAAVEAYLTTVCGKRPVRMQHKHVPAGWTLLVEVTPFDSQTPPPGLEALEIESAVELIPTGGLRIGRRSAWLLGAPPSLLLSGVRDPSTITLDGNPISIDETGRLATGEGLSRPGAHVVHAGDKEWIVEMVDPELPWFDDDSVSELRGTSISLPPGEWVLVGSVAGEIAVSEQAKDSALCQCGFEAVWAVNRGSSPPLVLHLGVRNHPPSLPARWPRVSRRYRAQLERWTATIYDVAIRHPNVRPIQDLPEGSDLVARWLQYTKLSRRLKRALRSTR